MVVYFIEDKELSYGGFDIVYDEEKENLVGVLSQILRERKGRKNRDVLTVLRGYEVLKRYLGEEDLRKGYSGVIKKIRNVIWENLRNNRNLEVRVLKALKWEESGRWGIKRVKMSSRIRNNKCVEV